MYCCADVRSSTSRESVPFLCLSLGRPAPAIPFSHSKWFSLNVTLRREVSVTLALASFAQPGLVARYFGRIDHGKFRCRSRRTFTPTSSNGMTSRPTTAAPTCSSPTWTKRCPAAAAADSAFHAAIGSGEQSIVTAVCLFALLRGCNRSCP